MISFLMGHGMSTELAEQSIIDERLDQFNDIDHQLTDENQKRNIAPMTPLWRSEVPVDPDTDKKRLMHFVVASARGCSGRCVANRRIRACWRWRLIFGSRDNFLHKKRPPLGRSDFLFEGWFECYEIKRVFVVVDKEINIEAIPIFVAIYIGIFAIIELFAECLLDVVDGCFV